MILVILYVICLWIEIKSLRRKKINIFYKENLLLVLMTSVRFPLAVLTLFFGCNAIKDFYKDDIAAVGYFFTFAFGALAYIFLYIKKQIYTFLPDKNKLSFLGIGTIYDRED